MQNMIQHQVRNLGSPFFQTLDVTLLGVLSFATYYLIKNPSTMLKLQAEIDEVIGDRQIQIEDIGNLHYTLSKSLRNPLRHHSSRVHCVAVIRDTLRLSP